VRDLTLATTHWGIMTTGHGNEKGKDESVRTQKKEKERNF
jgi:hypothetical protein